MQPVMGGPGFWKGGYGRESDGSPAARFESMGWWPFKPPKPPRRVTTAAIVIMIIIAAVAIMISMTKTQDACTAPLEAPMESTIQNKKKLEDEHENVLALARGQGASGDQ
jgi:hypothetical protein